MAFLFRRGLLQPGCCCFAPLSDLCWEHVPVVAGRVWQHTQLPAAAHRSCSPGKGANTAEGRAAHTAQGRSTHSTHSPRKEHTQLSAATSKAEVLIHAPGKALRGCACLQGREKGFLSVCCSQNHPLEQAEGLEPHSAFHGTPGMGHKWALGSRDHKWMSRWTHL